jgi:hypothetical protein
MFVMPLPELLDYSRNLWDYIPRFTSTAQQENISLRLSWPWLGLGKPGHLEGRKVTGEVHSRHQSGRGEELFR